MIITTRSWLYGASVAQWSERSPSTSEIAGSILSENSLNVTRSRCSTHVKRVSQHSGEAAKVVDFLRALQFPLIHREVDRVGYKINTATEVNRNCYKNKASLG